MNHRSIWSKGANLNREEAENMVKTFEKRSQFPDQIKINNEFLEFLNPRPGEHLLEVGSGSGVLSRLVAPKLIPQGRLNGLELSQEIVKLANKMIEDESIRKIIKYEVGNALEIPYKMNQFDGVFGARLLLHVKEPQKVIKELKRVVKPGKRVVLMDWDFGTLAIDHSDKKLTRKILNWRTDYKDGNNWSGRQLYRRLKSENFYELNVKPVISLVTDENTSLVQSVYHAASGALENEIITKTEYETWVTEIKGKLNANQFFASITYFFVKGFCPE